MKKTVISRAAAIWAIALAANSLTIQHAWAAGEKSYPDVKSFGYVQYTGTLGSSTTPHQFGFDRARLGVKGAIDDHIGFNVMLDLLKLNQPAKGDTTALGLLDAELSYKVMPGLKISAGQFKTPFSMQYTTSAAKLDTIGFGMVSNVSFDRGLGLMAGGRNVAGSGLGYDIGVFNAATRADGTAYTAGTLGRDDLWMGRLLFDGLDKAVHLEGGAARAAVSSGSSYTAGFVGLCLRHAPVGFKAEWLQGRQGRRKTSVIYGQLLVTVADHYELVGKWERTHYRAAGTSLTADNLTAGINAALYPDQPKRARLQLNYIAANRDASQLGTQVGFKKGYLDNQVKLLLQAGF